MDWLEFSKKLDYDMRIAAYRSGASPTTTPLAYQTYGNVTVVRDDRLYGGTKSRIALKALPTEFNEYVYVASWYGTDGIALALAAAELNASATLFTAYSNPQPPYINLAGLSGAKIYELPNMKEAQKAAKNYVQQNSKRYLVPAGFRTTRGLAALAQVALQVRESLGVFDEVFAAAGSGALITALQMAGLGREYYAVCVLHEVPDIGNAHVIIPAEPFAMPPSPWRMPPFPSATRYDAKVWHYATARPKHKHILMWNAS